MVLIRQKVKLKNNYQKLLLMEKKYITILELPTKGSPSDFDIKEFDEIYLSDKWIEKAKKDGIPYPNEYFIVYKINKNEEDKPDSINIMGSCGGGFTKIPWNTPNLVKRKK